MKSCAFFMMVTMVVLVLSGCAEKPARDRARPTERKSFSQRLNQDNGYKQDESGNWVPRSDQRSSFERIGESPYFKGKHQKKEFKTGEYRRKDWWGNRDFQVKEYSGETDGSRFRKTARQQGQSASENGSVADFSGAYETGTYGTNTAREAGAGVVPHMVDAETEVRRRVYQAPEVLNWSEQRQISREQTKSLLGR